MTQPNFIILYVANPPESARFYSRLLGTKPIEESSNFVQFALSDGMMLGLWNREEVTPAVQAPAGGTELAIAVESREVVDAALADFRAAGARVVLEPTELDFGYGFAVRDPDGHPIRVFCPTP